MKRILLLIALAFTANAATASDPDFWVISIDGLIYETPLPPSCTNCYAEFVTIHVEDRWIQLESVENTNRPNFVNRSGNWVTTVDGLIYETPLPDYCPTCTVVYIDNYIEDRWTRFSTDFIMGNGFE